MPKNGENITSLEMRNLILEALSIEDKDESPWGVTFKMYDYKGCISAIRIFAEHVAINRGIIDKVAELPHVAWGADCEVPYYGENTNFSDDELNMFSEEVHQLMFQNVISPGATGSYGDDWPYFHVTKYGLECLASRDVLPYDPEGYMTKLSAIASCDDWEKFYINQSLICYNSGANESSIIMLGLAGEYLAIKLIDAMRTFLQKNDVSLLGQLDASLKGKQLVSQQYIEYEHILDILKNQKDASKNYKYQQLRALSPLLDNPAKAVYATFLRLTRNELAHPSATQMDRIECLTMFISFIKYCETQHKYLDFYISNS